MRRYFADIFLFCTSLTITVYAYFQNSVYGPAYLGVSVLLLIMYLAVNTGCITNEEIKLPTNILCLIRLLIFVVVMGFANNRNSVVTAMAICDFMFHLIRIGYNQEHNLVGIPPENNREPREGHREPHEPREHREGEVAIEEGRYCIPSSITYTSTPQCECLICSENVTVLATTKCNHSMCQVCVRKIANTTMKCPMCRTPF